MQLRFLKTFIVVARTGSLTQASKTIHLSQSSISEQIQALEADLGASLFVRTRQGLQLTAAGITLISYAEEVLALMDEARAAVHDASGPASASLSIGTLETIAAARLPSWLARFQSAHPDTAVNIKIAGSGALRDSLVDGEIHAAFCFDNGEHDPRLAKRLISSEPLVCVGPPGSNSSSQPAGLENLAAERFITTEQGCVYRRMFDRAFADAGVEPPTTTSEVGSIAAIGQLVARGAGRAFVPRLAVAEMIDRGDVIELPWPGEAVAAHLVLVWRRRRVQPPALKLFLAQADQFVEPLRSACDRLRHAARCPS